MKDQKNKGSLGPFEKQFSKTYGWSKKRTESKDCMKKEQNFNSVAWKASTPAIWWDFQILHWKQIPMCTSRFLLNLACLSVSVSHFSSLSLLLPLVSLFSQSLFLSTCIHIYSYRYKYRYLWFVLFLNRHNA